MLTLLTFLQLGVPALILAAPFVLSAGFPPARRFLMAAIPVPLFVLLAVAAFWWLNREGAIVRAVEERVTEMVAGSELDAAKAVNDQLRRRNELLTRAAENYAAVLAEVRGEQAVATEQLEQEIATHEAELDTMGRKCGLADSDIEFLRRH